MGVITLGIGAAILVSYWQILLVTTIGVGVMFLSYGWKDDRVQGYLDYFRLWLQGTNGQLAISVASGSIAAIAVYLSLAICNAADNLWLGLATVLQTLGTIAIAPLLLWQFIRKNKQIQEATYQRALTHLTAPASLDRLMAIHQILNHDREQGLSRQQREEVAEYFELMLDREDSPQVRSALLSGLNQLATNPQSTPALSLPGQPLPSISLTNQAIAEEVEIESSGPDRNVV